MRIQRLILLVTSAVISLYPVLMFAQQSQEPATPPPWGWHRPEYMWGFGWGFWWMMPLFMLLMFIICAVVFRFLFGHRWGSGSHHWGPPWHPMDWSAGARRDPTHSALQILNERYAKGEIQKPEYEERKATILSSREP